jgi:hypothetical protein
MSASPPGQEPNQIPNVPNPLETSAHKHSIEQASELTRSPVPAAPVQPGKGWSSIVEWFKSVTSVVGSGRSTEMIRTSGEDMHDWGDRTLAESAKKPLKAAPVTPRENQLTAALPVYESGGGIEVIRSPLSDIEREIVRDTVILEGDLETRIARAPQGSESSIPPTTADGAVLVWTPSKHDFQFERPRVVPAKADRPALPSQTIINIHQQDGAVLSLPSPEREIRRYGPGSALVTVVVGLGNGAEDNNAALHAIAETVPSVGVNGIANLKPDLGYGSAVDGIVDLSRASDSRFPALSAGQASKIVDEHLSSAVVHAHYQEVISSGMSAAEYRSRNPENELVRMEQQQGGSAGRIRAAIDEALWQNQVSANPAVRSLQETQERKIRQGDDHFIIAHSEGEIVAAAATSRTISNIVGDPSLDDVERQLILSRIHVRSFGGAAGTPVVDSFGGQVGSWDRYRFELDPVSRVVPQAESSWQVANGFRPEDIGDLSWHPFRGYMDFVASQGDSFVTKKLSPTGSVRTITIVPNAELSSR